MTGVAGDIIKKAVDIGTGEPDEAAVDEAYIAISRANPELQILQISEGFRYGHLCWSMIDWIGLRATFT